MTKTQDLKQKQNEHLATLVAKFEAALQEAVDFATEHKLYFNIYPCYGAGATFYGYEVDSDDSENGWYSSSTSC